MREAPWATAGTGTAVVATMADARAEASRVGGREGVARVEGEEEEVTAEEHSVGPTAGATVAAKEGAGVAAQVAGSDE